MKSHTRLRPPRLIAGFTLVELMVAMLLGLIVVGGVISVFLAGQQSYRSNQALGEVQEGERTAFELMALDVRQAGNTNCDSTGRVANVLNNGPDGSATHDWWANFGTPVEGYDAGQTDPAIVSGNPARLAGTSSLALLGATYSNFSLASDTEPSGNFALNETSSTLQPGDVVIVCDPHHATLVQISGTTGNSTTFTHKTGAASNSSSPGNCSMGLGYPTVCTAAGLSYPFGINSQIAKLNAADWYIGTNPAGSTSLYRIGLVNTNGVVAPGTAQEMVRNVAMLTLTYHTSAATSYVNATAVSDWSAVDAVRILITVQSTNLRAGVNGQPLSRTINVTVSLRNRVS